jgi:hypothetical protein
MRNLLLLLFFLLVHPLAAQMSVNIGLINDAEPDNALEAKYEQKLQEEIMLLLQHRYEVNFSTYYYSTSNGVDIARSFSDAYAENDVVISVGPNTSSYAISLKRPSWELFH